jgi:hypothetical protein
MSLDRIMREEARLIVLRELASQPNYTLNESLAAVVLESFGIARSRDWVRGELRFLAEIGAATVSEAGSVLIVTATTRGLDHVSGRLVLDGVKRPSPRGA